MVNMSVPYRGPDGMSAQLLDELKARFGSRAQNKGFVSGYPDAARRGETGGHFPDKHGITHAIDVGVDIELDGSGLDTRDALWLAHHLRALGAAGKHPFSRRGYLIHDMSETTDPKPMIAGFHTGWKWQPYTGASPHSDHIHVTTGGDQQWGEAPQLAPEVYNSRASWGVAGSKLAVQTVKGYTRPVPDFIGVSQDWASNPTRNLPADHWIIKQFGNYQPNGHTGRDYAAAIGTDVYAVGPGKVLWANWGTKLPGDNSHAGYVSRWYLSKSFPGIVVVIDHGPFLGIYAHLNHTALNIGDTVKQGQRIAASGNTGGSTGPHLHFEVVPKAFAWGNGMYGRVDPDTYLEMKNVTVVPGYTGGTTINAPVKEWYQMAELSPGVAREIRKIVDQTVQDRLDLHWEYRRPRKGGAGGKTSYADVLLWSDANLRKVETKLDALVAGVTELVKNKGEGLDLNEDEAYAAIGRAAVEALLADEEVAK